MLLGYKPRFPALIESGSKIHTFRGKRKITPKIGERLYMYTGLRTKHTKKILGEYFLKSKQKVRMVLEFRMCEKLNTSSLDRNREFDYKFYYRIHIGGKRNWTLEELDIMAVNDGFENFAEFSKYWLNGEDKVVFSGYCYHWTDFKY